MRDISTVTGQVGHNLHRKLFGFVFKSFQMCLYILNNLDKLRKLQIQILPIQQDIFTQTNLQNYPNGQIIRISTSEALLNFKLLLN